MKKESLKNNKNKKIKEFRINFDIKTVFVFIFATFFLYTLFEPAISESMNNSDEVPLTKILQDIKTNKVKSVLVEDNKVTATYKNDKKLITRKEARDSFRQILNDNEIPLDQVAIETKDSTLTVEILRVAGSIIPAILLFAFFWFVMRQARGAQDSVFSFGQSKAKRFIKQKSNTTFKDVAGVEEAKKELEEIVDFLKNPEKYRKLGARAPKGVMLVGPAGTGKTLLAKATAGEASVPFYSIAGSEFMEMLVGIGAARVRDLFNTAKKTSPSIIFIDEIDAIGRARSRGVMSSHDEREQTLNQILVEMDGFTPSEQVIVVAATNRGDLLDPALLRPGRFDRRIMVDYPDVEGREAIIKIHSRNKPFDKNVRWDRVAKRTVGYSGADIENMMNEAAISAARNNKPAISMENIEDAATKVKLGPEKKRLQTELDRKITAYHEAGHAVVSHFQKLTDPVHRISIVSRGMALGYTLIPPGKDQLHTSFSQLLERLAVIMGGRAAEETVFKEITTGASNDFDQATNIARRMVTDFGMSSLGPVNFGPTQDITEWGSEFWEQNNISQEMMAKIDHEINRILTQAYEKAVQIVKKNRKALDKVAANLMEHESMNQDHFEKIVGIKKINK
ncbi:cell division protein FtsH [Candidatus Roizmanbacteria bacterium CG_4_9_14_0_2_um_filter_39_13]|uniref:ATP-dependent zinc metalloprotease FtsH n=2 Tax=Candidatus Roizmaniibacteriota TaxID=1752723 RepID=A0A2M8EWZ8_9BACT|nr:MAG: cell division protein FtsH [Candidatus Roizmanbacteria bacterium CG_4_10_14_0_2_um_filter_39_12]PJC30393.1 MAG: cell division protein FtsH [Candidatus Roizmanbacteria bacterium CG_4_9_14_0_2_um_filter_39_13]PJE61326.1 MAG: cell division protein FtsH [Candidatus Roizmanbacteria bacterium CG10_big_fil_rev_8_21_14_0_10_39_12]